MVDWSFPAYWRWHRHSSVPPPQKKRLDEGGNLLRTLWPTKVTGKVTSTSGIRANNQWIYGWSSLIFVGRKTLESNKNFKGSESQSLVIKKVVQVLPRVQLYLTYVILIRLWIGALSINTSVLVLSLRCMFDLVQRPWQSVASEAEWKRGGPAVSLWTTVDHVFERNESSNRIITLSLKKNTDRQWRKLSNARNFRPTSEIDGDQRQPKWWRQQRQNDVERLCRLGKIGSWIAPNFCYSARPTLYTFRRHRRRGPTCNLNIVNVLSLKFIFKRADH